LLNTILYIDDDLINLEVFKTLLEDDYDIITTSSTSLAYDLLHKHHVKVIIADQRMPEENGLAFLERISPEFPDIIKIIFTAHLDHDAAMKAVNQGGIYRYILKPWNTKEMKITIDNAISHFDLQEENKNLLKALQHKNQELEGAFNKLKESEKKFFNIFANSTDGIAILKEKEILDANPAFLKITGYSKHSEKDSINNYIRRHFPNFLQVIPIDNPESPTPSNEIELMLPGSGKKYLEIFNRPFNNNGEEANLSILHDITERKMIDQKIMEAILQTQEEEQSKNARELHDGLGPILSTLKMYIEWLAVPENVNNKDTVTQKTIVAINEAISIVKEIANKLSPHVLQRFGLVNALQSHIDNMKEAFNIDIVLSSNLYTRLSSNMEHTLYRVLLECMNNTMKHANAQKIIVKFKLQSDMLTINYSDNGVGFDVKNVLQNAKGMGLFNMQNRIKLIGGDFKIKSNLNIGTDIEINIATDYGQKN
jgi:PAS domain S-box-containing protein